MPLSHLMTPSSNEEDNSNCSDGVIQCSRLPNSILELPCVLCHPALPEYLNVTAKLLATSKAVAAAATAVPAAASYRSCT